MPAFISNSPWTSVCVALLACLPALMSWWGYRALLRGGDPAVLPERMVALAQRVAGAVVAAVALIVILVGWHTTWILPLLLLGVGCTTHPARRILLGETWPLRRYLEWRARTFAALLGFWVLLAVAPAIVNAASPSARWWIGGALLAVLVTWHHWYARVLLFVLNATPLNRADLDAVFEPVLSRASVSRPKLWRAGTQGGVMANALAMPGLSAGRVLFFDTLIERLSPTEIAAIFAHEVAHLEHFNARRLRRLYAAGATAIVVAIAGTMAIVTSGSPIGSVAVALWPICVIVSLAVRASRMQKYETNSDLRACELCGDPEALVGALTRLHEIHHMPRRWSSQAEEHATHPSLARRIQAIRGCAAGTPARGLEQQVVAISSEPGRLALFDRDRVTFLWAEPGTPGLMDNPLQLAKRIEAIAYDQLSELRVTTSVRGAATLTARGRQSGRWTMPLQRAEAARVQAALNTVDQLIGSASPAMRGSIARRASAIAALLFAYVLQALLPVLMPALVALWRPARPVFMALAASLAATAFVTGADSTFGAIRVTVLSVLAAAAMWQAHRASKTQQDEPSSLRVQLAEVLALAFPALSAAVMLVAVQKTDLFGIHTGVRDTPVFAASLVTLAVYLAASGRQLQRRLGLAAAALAAVSLWIGSSSFLTNVVGDPLVADTPVLTERTVRLAPIARASVDGYFDRVLLSSDGRHFLLASDPEEYDDIPSTSRRHVIAAFDGWSRTIDARDVVFVDNQYLLTVVRRHDGVQLHAEDLRGTAKPSWRVSLDGLDVFSVGAAADGRWHLVDRNGNRFIRVDGRLGATEVAHTNLDVAVAPQEHVSLHQGGVGQAGLGVAVEWGTPAFPWLLYGGTRKSSLLRVENDRTTRVTTSSLTTNCADPAMDVAAYICVAFDGRMSRFWKYDAVTGQLEPKGQVRGQFWIGAQDSPDRIAGTRGGNPVVVQLDEGTLTTYMLSDSEGGWDNYHMAGEFIVSAVSAGDRTDVMLYRVAPARTGTYAATSLSR
jgi:Zn-dependent protease with chaperone function